MFQRKCKLKVGKEWDLTFQVVNSNLQYKSKYKVFI